MGRRWIVPQATGEGDVAELPWIISVDDHVVEPPTLWWDRLPASRREQGPRVERRRGVTQTVDGLRTVGHGEGRSQWSDVWVYDDMEFPMTVGFAKVGRVKDEGRGTVELLTYDEMHPGCYDQAARLADMDLNHVEAALCFPTVPRFCGQAFLERRDHELALECLRIYNDWMIDEWCGGAGRGRLIPLNIVPLWDPVLAAAEVRRCAANGSHAICFPEAMMPLGLPTLYSGEWDVMLRACEETETVVNMHIGSSSRLPGTSPDAPLGVTFVLAHENGAHALIDWVLSGALTRFPHVNIALSEAQAGWMPYVLQRLDDVWARGDAYETDLRATLPCAPSEVVRGRIYTCIFNDLVGLNARHQIGMDHLMFETDYPHSDSSFPVSTQVAEKLVTEAGLNDHEIWQFLRGNAIACYRLDRHGITA